jgi:hypothetical protein
MRQLIWKEWHEQRWKLGFGCIVLCAFAMIGLRTRAVPDESIMIGTCALGVLLLPILAAAGLIPAERGEGTLRTLLALPVAPWKVLMAKMRLGAVLCAGPILAAAVVSVLLTRGREVSEATTWMIYLRSTATALSLFAWMVCLTTRSSSEGRGTALAVGVLVFWLLATAGLRFQGAHWYWYWNSSYAYRSPRVVPLAVDFLWPLSPFFFVFAPPEVPLAAGVGAQSIIAILLGLFAVRAITREDRS